SMTDNHDKYVTCTNLLDTGFDGLLRARTEELHRVVLELEAADGIEHAFALLTEVAEGAADENRERRRHLVVRLSDRAGDVCGYRVVEVTCKTNEYIDAIDSRRAPRAREAPLLTLAPRARHRPAQARTTPVGGFGHQPQGEN